MSDMIWNDKTRRWEPKQNKNWMREFNQRVEAWRTAAEMENEHKAILSKPVKNDPALTAPTKVEILKPFYVDGQPTKIGDSATLDRNTALSLQAIGKCRIK